MALVDTLNNRLRYRSDWTLRGRSPRPEFSSGWLLLLVLLLGAPAPCALAQKVIVTANAMWTYSGYIDYGPPLGAYQDSLNVSMQGTVIYTIDTNDSWGVLSSNYSFSVSGSGSDPISGTSWTWIADPSNDAPNDSASIDLDFAQESTISPFDDGSFALVVSPPAVQTSPPDANTSFDYVNLVPLPWAEPNVPTDNQAFTVSGTLATNGYPIIEQGISITSEASYFYTVSYQPGPTNLQIIAVQTPATASGNQHTFISTDPITLKASVGAARAGIPVDWTIRSLNGASPALLDTETISTGSDGISTLTLTPSETDGFVSFRKANFTTGSHTPNPPLAFDVTVQAQGQQATLSQSGLGTLMQDDTDILRQEYVDYGTIYQGASFTPQRSDVVSSLGKGYNGGNYGVQLSKGLDATFQAIQQAYQGSTITFDGVTATLPATAAVSINSGFRNPQRNKIVGSQYPKTSIHMFGGALDLKPVPTWVLIDGKRQWPDIHKVLYPALQQAAATQGRAFAENGATPVPLGSNGSLTNSSGKPVPVEDHIHVQW